MKIREYCTWSTVPIIANLITFAFYVSAFRFLRDIRVSFLIAMGTDLVLYVLLFLCTLWVLCSAQEVERSFRKSSCLILLLVMVRIAEVSLAFLPITDKPYKATVITTRSIIAQLAFPIIFWILYFAADEYFGSHLTRGDPLYIAADSNKAIRHSKKENEPLLKNNNTNTASTQGYLLHELDMGDTDTKPTLIQPETICLVLLTLMAVYNSAVVPVYVSSLYYYLLDQGATWILLISGMSWVLLKVLQLKPISHHGVFFGTAHSDGFAWLLLLLGAAGRLIINIYYNALGDQIATTRNFGNSYFVSLGKEVFTQIIPYAFHLFNVHQRKRYSFLPSQEQLCDTAGRIKLVFYISIISLHLVLVGYVLEVGTSRYHLVNAALCAALLASADLCFVVLGFMAPIGSFLCKYFALGVLQSNEKNYLHRNMAYSASLFALIHIGIHTTLWGTLLPVQALIQPDHQLTLGISTAIYKIRSVPVLTGILMVTCLIGAFLTGTLLPRKQKYAFANSLHIPLACVGFAVFFAHGYGGIQGEPIGSNLFFGFFIFSTVITTIYFTFSQIRTLEVDLHKSKFGSKFILLSVKYSGSNYIPPGAYFNVFASDSSHLSIFHCHSFSVFALRNSRLLFLIRRRGVEGNRVSFTARLAIEQPTSIRIQGPFKGPASAFVLSLNSAPLHRLNKCIVLCGWESGIASIFSLLEYFKNNSYANIHSILCVFSEIEDSSVREELHDYVAAMAHEWPWNSVQLCIAEVKSLKTIYDFTDACSATVSPRGEWQQGITNTEIWFSENENIEEGGTIQARLLYYCGSDSLDASRLSRWKLYIESP